MGDKRVSRGRGDDYVGSTISQRNTLQDRSLRSGRGTAQAAKVSVDGRAVVNAPHAETAGFQVFKEEPGGRARGKSKAVLDANRKFRGR